MELQDAYTIEPVDKPGQGWTVSPDSSKYAKVFIKPIVSTPSIPPKYPLNQLWRFEEVVV